MAVQLTELVRKHLEHWVEVRLPVVQFFRGFSPHFQHLVT